MDDNAAPGETGPRPGPAPSKPLDDIVEGWWADHFPGSAVAQVAAAWNHVFAAKEELKRRLVTSVRGVN